MVSLLSTDISPSQKKAASRRSDHTAEQQRRAIRQRALRLAKDAQLIADEARRLAERADELPAPNAPRRRTRAAS
jgi:hypothetical protein